eukprot:CAMPEP_0115876368 /NCGR_PEP_ID=MMETSP0287-20121206/25626_1 /TAXON_ID=412157 /ORGANISM="Chrysochromulina rotalis, Strain UIO044" /LENGTH=49 /DNA_ID=CAMNT_0003331759 /DNA_START=457 /DNA_END=606 /DNA_ORIENTATION=+
MTCGPSTGGARASAAALAPRCLLIVARLPSATDLASSSINAHAGRATDP